mgnify:CR=1 FL=1
MEEKKSTYNATAQKKYNEKRKALKKIFISLNIVNRNGDYVKDLLDFVFNGKILVLLHFHRLFPCRFCSTRKALNSVSKPSRTAR